MTKSELNEILKAIKILRDNADDEVASLVVNCYPTMKYNNELIKCGERIRFENVLYRASVDLWDVENNNPTNTPALWEAIDYKQGYRIIPETITVGTAFTMGEYGWWKDELYKSLINANVYTPEQYSIGWEKIIIEEKEVI
jgi:hypothetical protein